MERFICIHGHFYQPPRENPWLEAIEWQESAYPYHDWNELITAECYAPNAAARILGEGGRIDEIVNNYGRISYNFGPTLLAWLEAHAPDVYEAIQRADRRSAGRFGGHGSAMAQAYNHMIMPLANERDRRTQVRWGVRDFEHRFGRKPDGMWLPETAVDLDSLEALADEGIRFTVLAPNQAARVRPLPDEDGAAPGEWADVTGSRVDTTRPYLQRLPSGRDITLFFYDGPISRAVAFEKLLSSGERFAGRLTNAFHGEDRRSQLAHIATDGETYGHHHPLGDMALAYALRHIKQEGLGRLTNYSQYMELHPPRYEVEILEDTAWSCAHGVGRWERDCGCNTGGKPEWNQAWRRPLREALDWLREELAPPFEEAAGELVDDPWAARDAYVDVVLDRSDDSRARFLTAHAKRELTDEERVRLWKLLEMQRHAMLMYTSCGWFFDELSGIETVQVMQYAGRALQLAEDLFGTSLEPEFLDRLERAPSNVPEHGNGKRIYEKFVVPARVDLAKVAAHFAVSSLFDDYDDETSVYCYRVHCLDRRTGEAGRARLTLGHAIVRSEITEESAHLCFGAVRVVDHTVSGGVRAYVDDASYGEIADEILTAFRHADFTTTMRLMERHFDAEVHSLRSLFKDEQRRILQQAMKTPLAQAEQSYRQIYERNAPLMRFLRGLSLPQPPEFETAAELVINADLRREAASDDLDVDTVMTLLADAAESDVDVDAGGIGYALTHTVERAMRRFHDQPDDLDELDRVTQLLQLLPTLPFEINLWTVQNLFWEMLRSELPDHSARAEKGEEEAVRWVKAFTRLGELLRMVVDVPEDDALPLPEGSGQTTAEPAGTAPGAG